MSVQLSKIDDIPAARVAAVTATLSGLIQEKYPEIDLQRGVFHDLVLYLNGVLNSLIQENIDRILSANSLLKVENDPTLADETVVDQILSNYNITRSAGVAATGAITFVLATDQTTKFIRDTELSANGVTYSLRETYVITKEPVATNANNYRVMTPVGDGTYVVTLPATATTVGVAGNISAGTLMQSVVTLDNVLSIYAATNFTGGLDPASNAAYLQSLRTGMAAKTVGGRASYEAFLRAQPNLSNILHISVVGAGDAEQKRDQHGVIPISGGGKVDVYVQTTAQAQQSTHNVQATYIGTSANGTLWQVNIDRELAPGYYYFNSAAPAGSEPVTNNQYEIKNDYRVTNLYEVGFVPDIRHYTEGVYSRYQTGYVIFEDVDTPSNGLTPYASTKMYRLVVTSMPLLREVDIALTSRENRPRGTDILVKAAVPCFTKITVSIHSKELLDIPEETINQIKYDIVTAIQTVGFSGQLHASLIIAAAVKHLTQQQVIDGVDMFGKIRRPDGKWVYVRGSNVIKIPDDPENLVTSRTTAFLVGVDDVEVAVTSVTQL